MHDTKMRMTLDSFDSNSVGNETEYLNGIINKYDFMIFVKSDCPYSFKLKQLLDTRGIEHHELYLDNHINGPRLQAKLTEMTGGKSIPYVYVKRKYIGGYMQTAELISSGLLDAAAKGIDISQLEFDLVVIGGGTSGIAAALEAAKLGKKVALCDSVQPTRHGTTWGLGGSPGGSGSIAKDVFHRASLLPHDFTDARFFGWDSKPPEEYHWANLSKALEEHHKSVSWVHRKNLREVGVQYINGWARFKDNHTVTVTDPENHEKDITARSFIIATGSRHRPLEVKGEEENTLSVEDLLSLQTFSARRALVIGSCKDGLEIAGILSGLKVDTSVIVRRKILPGGDSCVVERLKKFLEAQGVKFIENVTVLSFIKTGDNIRAEGKRLQSEMYQKPMEFSQRKLSELGSRKSPPPKDVPAEPSREPTQETVTQPSDKTETAKTPENNDSANKTPAGDQKNDQNKKDDEKLASGSGEPGKKDTEGINNGEERVDKEGSKTNNNEDSGDYLDDFQVVVVAAGRRPNVADLGLQNLDIKLDRGTCKIIVNAFDQTSVENIFAVGQVANAMNADVQAVAKKAAQLLARRMFSMSSTKMEYRKVPMLILTPVEYAYIGDTEETAKKIHGKIEVYHNIFTTAKSSLPNRFDNRSYVKLICGPRVPNVGSQVLGIHLLAPNAGEVLQGFVTAFDNCSLTKEQLDEMVGLHPTVAEIFSDLQITKASGAEIGLNVI
ncbi:hypothetical protein GE061_019819 [Apolygus lucorum]|uniref:Uncharacterized protein n=1 Tax=Apolygus lucorum TaxID=248454 RepID=A0A6A4JLD0_APOLU|nr:hypothetical protein GE061_019819 [Apolygus lucorum]